MIKQDMPPAGGYAPINYKYVPLKKGLSGLSKLFLLMASSGVGAYFFAKEKDNINNYKIEMRCARLALRPMLEAEMDRLILKQLKRNRDAEERVMKDVKGWEVGKWYDSPIYFTVGPDEYYKPSAYEYYMHTPHSWYYKSFGVLKDN